ncbi:hypothetical protein DL96DRAFT_1556592 [Flagelloscypha sp. PMI_526]|nr:hypothetical protein DL96DRAFT_1556592 [Flagelloscypha sp. PMI_526]
MARFAFVTLIATVVLAMGVSAAPLSTRQIGNLECNLARASIVKNMFDSKSAIDSIQDATGKAAAQAGLDEAFSGVKTIGLNIITGKAAGADARTQVENGLQTALTEVKKLDPAADPAVQDATDNLTAAVADGASVVTNCK